MSEFYCSVLFGSVTQSCSTPRNPMGCSMPGFPVHHQLPELTQTHVHRVGDAIQISHLLSSPSPPTFNLSQHQGLFKWVSSSHQVAEVLAFQLQHLSFQWIFRTDWLDLLAVQGPLKSLLQHPSSKASILWRSAFFIVQLSHPYMTTGKTIALTTRTFVGKVMSLLFNMLSRFVIAANEESDTMRKTGALCSKKEKGKNMSSGNKHKNSYLEGHYDLWKRPHTTQTLTTTAQVPNGGRSKKTGQEESTKALKP